MDTTKQNILMLEKAVEIQKAWKPKTGDVFSRCGIICFVTLSNINLVNFDDSQNCLWLPRQDQLQGMLNKELYELVWDFTNFLAPMNGSHHFDNKSMEQLWLVFAMKEKYNKTWNGEDWKEIK